jgi:hypothetical protein
MVDFKKYTEAQINFMEGLYQKYNDLFAFAQKHIEKDAQFLIGQNANSLKKRIVLFHFTRALNLLNAICLLCKNGFVTEAMVLLRSLFNLLVNIRWLMADDSEERIKRFADFEIIFKYQQFKAVGDMGDKIKAKALKDLEANAIKIKNKYGLAIEKKLLIGRVSLLVKWQKSQM